MKSNLKKAMMPLAVVVLGAAAAFATNAAKTSSSSLADVHGYIYNQETKQCVQQVMCSTIPGPVCRNAANQQVFGLNDSDDLTVCTWQLYRLQ